ncbi:hypothetical protein EUX98_g4607 [Antrodiella citrinella]|uniref:Uncharacterized protein n=1 Tax=Antrodiella citrinella TaxID=2447956 RepID=A0A4S4MTL5_9APHY|nr:hypothetical protein EUX98_g4607 [Antrodiella citrinella]
MPKKLDKKLATMQIQVEDSDDELEKPYGEEAGEEDSSMLEMISMLQEYQKRKASKTSARATAFQNKKQAIYAEARKNADATVTEGVAYIEHYKKTIIEIKAREASEEQQMRELSTISTSFDDPVEATFSLFALMFDELSHKRATDINEACGTIEKHSADRQLSRRRLIRDAKSRMEEQLEEQRVATDASALIKHYKSLLLS